MSQVVWLARHGNRQDFVDPAWPETAERPHDPGLSPDGIEQAQKLGRRLAGEGIDYIFASPFLRTVQTAYHVAEALDMRIYLEPGIEEWLNPEWFQAMPETLSLEELARQYPRIDLKYTPQLTPEYPETQEQATRRAAHTARKLADTYSGDLLIVGHGASVSGIANALAVEPGEFECALCSLFKLIRHDDRWNMELSGNVEHLDHRKGVSQFN